MDGRAAPVGAMDAAVDGGGGAQAPAPAAPPPMNARRALELLADENEDGDARSRVVRVLRGLDPTGQPGGPDDYNKDTTSTRESLKTLVQGS